MAEYLIQSETLDDIANAIHAKTGGSSAMTPAEMAAAIAAIPSGGGSSITVEPLTVTSNGTQTAPSGKAYNKVVANVPNSYGAADEGKVVQNGALVSQTAHAEVTQNGTIDTTLNNSVVVNTPVGYTPGEFASLAKPRGTFETDEVFEFENCAFTGRNVTVIHAPNATKAYDHFLKDQYGPSNKVVTFFGPKCVVMNSAFKDAKTALKTVVVKDISAGNAFINCETLETVDIQTGNLGAYSFQHCKVINKLILRSSTIQGLGNNAFNYATKFASGGEGGTVYIPESLYNHLGDGTADDYKAATNWSTYEGYGTITWAKIEGSQYETAYADGTAIS